MATLSPPFFLSPSFLYRISISCSTTRHFAAAAITYDAHLSRTIFALRYTDGGRTGADAEDNAWHLALAISQPWVWDAGG